MQILYGVNACYYLLSRGRSGSTSAAWALFTLFDAHLYSNCLLNVAIMNEDEIRVVRLLLSNTVLRVNVNGTLSAQFLCLLNAFQGDCHLGTGCLFVLEGASVKDRLRVSVL